MALSTVVPSNNIGIQGKFLTKNRCFTNPVMVTKKALFLHSTATPGALAGAFFNNWNSSSASVSVEFVIDDKQILQYLPIGKGGSGCVKSWHCGTGTTGKSCNGTHIATEMCEPIETQLIPIVYQEQGIGVAAPRTYSVKRIQMELIAQGYLNDTADGVFGPKTQAATIAFQKANGLSQTGKVNKTTLAKLAARKGSYAAYDVAGATPFFNGCYNNAVRLFAWLCGYVGAKASEILSHSEGYQKGVASNHSDVKHWFDYHGKTMNDFRRDVQLCIDGKYVPLGTSVVKPAEPDPTPAPSTPTPAPTPEKSQYAKDVEAVVASGMIGSGDYWLELEQPGKTNDDLNPNYVWALLRQAGSYYCMKSVDYAKICLTAIDSQGSFADHHIHIKDSYTLHEVHDILMVGCCICTDTAWDCDSPWNPMVDALHKAGVINTPSVWYDLTEEKINPSFVHSLIRQIGDYACSVSYGIAIEVLVPAIGMNSPEYWNAGKYSINNVKCLFAAIASHL